MRTASGHGVATARNLHVRAHHRHLQCMLRAGAAVRLQRSHARVHNI